MSKCFLVLGTPRSGTSCVAGILHHLGIPMGEKFPDADVWNPAGYFQDIEFEVIVAEELRCQFPVWREVRDKDHTSGDTRIRNLAIKRRMAYDTWGVKSNRLVYFLDAFIEGAEDVSIITTERSLKTSIESWQARAACEKDIAAEVIRNMSEAIKLSLALCKKEPILEINYDDLIQNPKLWVEQIAGVTNLPVTEEAIRWVNSDLRRYFDG